jgi:SAM-dependent methyltransferase
VELLIDFGSHPIAHHFLNSPEAKETVYPISLMACRDCLLIQLQEPVPAAELYTNYVTLSSWKHQPHMPSVLDLVAKLANDPQAAVLELGCNDGVFLEGLLQRGFRNTIGIEPAIDAYHAAQQRGVPVIQGYFCPKTAQQLVAEKGLFQVIVARQVLEHIADLTVFAQAIRASLADGGYLVIEVPDFDFCLDALDYSGVWEEHTNYFTSATLTRFFALAGVDVFHEESVLFSGKAKIMAGRKTTEGANTTHLQSNSTSWSEIATFRDKWPEFHRNLQQRLERQRRSGRATVVYGAGCRACSLVNFSGIGEFVDWFVDDQPEKQSRFMPGSRRPIRPSTTVNPNDVGLCLLAVNSENEKKVLGHFEHLAAAGIEFKSVLPPSENLLPIWPR